MTVLFVVGGSLVIAANVVAHGILGDVNARLSHDQQHSMLFSNIHFFQIWSELEKFFPDSHRRAQFVVCFLAGLLCCVAACLRGFFMTR
jgi:hypothetical protein